MTVPNHHFIDYEKVQTGYDQGPIYDYVKRPSGKEQCGQIDDGFYGIANSTAWAYNRFKNLCGGTGNYFTNGRDHTGNQNGAMLIINSGAGIGETIYGQDIDFDLCDAKKYRFKIFTSSVTSFPAQEAMLTLIVKNRATNDVIAEIDTKEIPLWEYTGTSPFAEHKWSEYYADFTANNGDKLSLQIINNSLSGVGNDFVIDDISLYRYDEDVNVPDMKIEESAIASATGGNTCSYEAQFSVVNSVLEAWQKIDNSVYVLWQKSEDGGLTWSNINDQSGINKSKLKMVVDGTETSVFRVIVTASPTDNEAKEQAEYIAIHNAPKNGCAFYSISNTISSIKPEPNCQYKETLRELWKEDFGVCDTFAFGTNSGMALNAYTPGGKEQMSQKGEYIICSIPDSAIYYMSCDWDGSNCKKNIQFAPNNFNGVVSPNDVSYFRPSEVGNAFAFIRMNKGDNKANPVFYKKTISIPLCPCKTFMFNAALMCKGSEWGTNVVTKMVIYDNRGNELAAESVPLSFKGGFGKRLASVPFSVPTGYSGEITVELSLDYSYNQDNVSCNDWLDFAIDDLSITICGETMPKPAICIDGNDGLHLLSGFECTDETPHKVVMSGLNDLLKEYPDAAFIWQTSVDGGATWNNLSASSTSVDYEYTGNLETLYRVVIGETETVAEEVAATGRHKDECSVYYITNVVGFKCKESECRAPKLSFDADKEVKKIDTVFCATPDAIDINVIQTNKVNVDDFYIAIMGADKKYEAAKVMSPAPTSTDNIWKISLDKKSANYMIYAINDTCKSDTLYINVDVREPIELKPVDDLMFCAIEVPTVMLKITSGEAESVFLKYGSHEGKAEVTLSEAFVIFPDIAEIIGETEVSAYAESKDGKCKSETITFKMDYESIPDFTFDVDNNIICSGDKTELHLNIAEGHNSKNHKYEIEGSDGKPVDINNLVFFPTEGITYTVTATSDACQSIISREISLYVVLPIALNLETVPSPVLKTLGYEEAVCAPATVSFILKDNLNLTSWDWEYRKKGEKDFTKWETESTKTTNSFEVTEETSFRVTSKVDTEVCKNFSSFIITIKAENKPEFSLALDKDRICESGDIELSLLTKDSYDPSIITATANGNPITLNDNKYSANISETTKFEVTVSGEVCGETKFDTTAYVDHPLSFTLSADKTKICEGEDVTFTVTGESNGIVWYKSTDGNKYTEFTPESGNKITPDETIYVYAGTPSDGACGAFKVDPIKIEVEKPISFDLISDVNGKICAGTEVNFAIKNLVGTPKTSKWEKNDIEINAVSTYKDAPVSTSTYKVTLNGDVCPSVEQEIEIEVESADALTLTADKSLICEGESVTLTKDYGTNDPASVTWWSETAGMRTKISETSTVAPSKSTSYYLSVKGSVCDEVYSQPAIVEVEPINDFTFTVENEMICEGNEVKLILGLKKFSSDENNFILTANDKELEESDYTSSIIVGVPDYIMMKEFTIHPTEPTTYELSMPGKVCKTETKSLDVKVQKQPKLSVTIDKTGICEGESVTITPTAENADDLIWKASEDDGNTFTDLTNSMSAQTFTPEKTSIYSITSAGSNICEPAEWIQEIEVEKPISINFDQDIDTICKGWPVTLRANINGKKNMIDSYNTSYTFEWSKTINGKDYTSLQHYPHNFGAVDVEIDTNIVFRLIVTGKYCNSDTIYTTYLIDKVPTLDSVVVYPSDHICEGDEITIKAYFSSDNLKDVWFWGKYVNPDDWNWYEKEREKFGDAEYNLSRAGDAEQKFSPTSEILYYINGFTSAFCETNTLETKIYVDKPISLDPPTDTTLCEGSSVTITTDANNGYHYVWTVDRDTLSTSSKMTYKEDEPANVKLEASKGGCSESYDFAINVVPTPHIVSVEESGANAFEVAVEGGSGAYLFDFGDGYQSSSTLSPATYGRTYKVKVKDELGCESDTTIKTPTYELEFPVSFTPNGDGENDVWEIKNIDKYPGATVKIFDRFGKKLCDMKAAEMDAWDGTYNGRALPSTDYWYEIQIDEIDKTYIGHFTLIRN